VTLLNGFMMKSTAPDCMARTAVGTVPCAVMKIIGNETLSFVQQLLQFRPLIPGMPHIENQASEPVRLVAVQERLGGRVELPPSSIGFNDPAQESRTAASSSTTKIVAFSGMVQCARR